MRVPRLVVAAAGVLIYACRFATDTCACTPALYSAVVHGQVRTAAGAPAPGVPLEVALYREACTATAGPDVNVAQRTTQTDGEGAYQFQTASPGAISAGCARVTARVNAGTQGETTVAASAPIVLTSSAGQSRVRIDLVLP
jgi:hypothetical protein